MTITAIFSSLKLEKKIVELYSVSLTWFSAAEIVTHPLELVLWGSGSTPMDQLLERWVVEKTSMLTEVPVWYAYIGGSMPHLQLEISVVRYLMPPPPIQEYV